MSLHQQSSLASFISGSSETLKGGSWNDLPQLAHQRDELAASPVAINELQELRCCETMARLPLYHIPCPDSALQQNLREVWREGPSHPLWLWGLTWISCFAAPWGCKRKWELSAVSDDDLSPVLTFLLKQPVGWAYLKESDLYANHLEKVLTDLWEHFAVANLSRQQLIDEVLLKYLDISLALFGQGNLRALPRIRAKLLQDILSRLYPNLPLGLPSSPAPHSGKQRLGIIIRYFKPFIDNWMLAGFLNGLPRDRYEITLYSVQDIERRIDPDAEEIREFRTRFMSLIDRYVPLDTTPLPQTVESIRQGKQDIILFGNTMQVSTAKAHLIHAYRLAPTQIITTITTSSSGFDNVDYYISAACTEPSNAAEHYHEKLLLMDGFFYALAFDPMPSCVSRFVSSPLSTSWLDRLGIPPTAPVLISGAGWPKLTPETIDAWGEILEQAPDAHLILYPNSPSWRGGWFAKAQAVFIQDRLGSGAKRCHIVEPRAVDDILQLVSCATLYLDAFPYSGNMSLREPLLMGCPVITRITPHQRGLQAAAVLRSLGMDDLVAQDTAGYCKKALSILNDKNAADDLRRRLRISRQQAPFYDVRSVSEAFSDILDKEVRRDLKV